MQRVPGEELLVTLPNQSLEGKSISGATPGIVRRGVESLDEGAKIRLKGTINDKISEKKHLASESGYIPLALP